MAYLFEDPESYSYDDCRVGWTVTALRESNALPVDFLAVSSRGIALKLDAGAVGLQSPASMLFPCDLRLPNLMFFKLGAMTCYKIEDQSIIRV